MPIFAKFDGVDGESKIVGDGDGNDIFHSSKAASNADSPAIMDDIDQFTFKDVEPEDSSQTREHILLGAAPEEDTGLLLPAVQSVREAARHSEAPDGDDGWQGDINMDGAVDFYDFM